MNNDVEELLPIQHLLIGACASIGILSLPEMIGWLQKLIPGLEVMVVMTQNAATLIPPASFSVVTRQRTYCEWQDTQAGTVPHIELTEWADMLLVMPATANVLGKAAHGIADDLLTSCIVAANCPTIFVPSLNVRMWQKPAVQRNVTTLREDDMWVLDPVEGIEIATGNVEVGSMPPLRTILKELAQILRYLKENRNDGS